jgi:hypothetical protein
MKRKRLCLLGLFVVLALGVALFPVPAYNCQVRGLPILSTPSGKLDVKFHDGRMYLVEFPQPGKDSEIGRIDEGEKNGGFWNGKYGERYSVKFYKWGVVVNGIEKSRVRHAIGFRRVCK